MSATKVPVGSRGGVRDRMGCDAWVILPRRGCFRRRCGNLSRADFYIRRQNHGSQPPVVDLLSNPCTTDDWYIHPGCRNQTPKRPIKHRGSILSEQLQTKNGKTVDHPPKSPDLNQGKYQCPFKWILIVSSETKTCIDSSPSAEQRVQ